PVENNWNTLARSKHTVVNLRRPQMLSLQVIGIGEQVVSIGISRVEFHCSREILLGLNPIIATSVDVTRKNEKRRVIRQARTRDCELLQSAIIITVATKQKIGHRKVCFG